MIKLLYEDYYYEDLVIEFLNDTHAYWDMSQLLFDTLRDLIKNKS